MLSRRIALRTFIVIIQMCRVIFPDNAPELGLVIRLPLSLPIATIQQLQGFSEELTPAGQDEQPSDSRDKLWLWREPR